MKNCLFISTLCLSFVISCEKKREPGEVTQKQIMRQLDVALEAYENDFGEPLPINNLKEIQAVLAGANVRKKVYFEPAPFADQYGRKYIIDKGQIVNLGEDGVLGTQDDIRVPFKK